MAKFRIEGTVTAEVMVKIAPYFAAMESFSIKVVEPPVVQEAVKTVAKTVKRMKRRPRYRQFSPSEGGNGVIMRHLNDGKPHMAKEMGPLFVQIGLSGNSVASRLVYLRDRGLIFQPTPGFWQIHRTLNATQVTSQA